MIRDCAWLTEERSRVEIWASRPNIVELMEQFLAESRSHESLLVQPTLAELRGILADVVKASVFDDLFVIAPEQTRLTSMCDINTGCGLDDFGDRERPC